MKISILIIFLLGFLNCIQGQTGKQITTKIENTNHKKRNKSIDLKALKIEKKK